jgi:outer membrane protein assembly factor BamE (lipoprotein component of BamABCDE complex)
VTDQTVLHVRFDQAGNVASVNQTGKELIASIDPSGDKTPTLGRKKSFFDELFGNIGTISQPGLGNSNRPPQQ